MPEAIAEQAPPSPVGEDYSVDPDALRLALQNAGDRREPDPSIGVAWMWLTPRGWHVSDAGKDEVIARHRSYPQPTPEAIAAEMGLHGKTVRSIIAKAKSAPPAAEAGSTHTPRGFHVQQDAKDMAVALQGLDPLYAHAKTAHSLAIDRSTIWRLHRHDALQPAPGIQTPGGHLTQAGREDVMRRHDAGEELQAIADTLQVDVVAVRATIRRNKPSARAARPPRAAPAWTEHDLPFDPRMKSPKQRHLSQDGIDEVARLRTLPDPPRTGLIAHRVGLSKSSLKAHIKKTDARAAQPAETASSAPAARKRREPREPGAPRAARPASARHAARPVHYAPLRPIARVADWNAVQDRDWSAGDLIELTAPGMEGTYEVRHTRHQGDPIVGEDFWPIVRGG